MSTPPADARRRRRIAGQSVSHFAPGPHPRSIAYWAFAEGVASCLPFNHLHEMTWGASWPDWCRSAYEMLDALDNVVQWHHADDSGLNQGHPDQNEHPAASLAAAVDWADQTEHRYLDASAAFICECGLDWPQLPANPMTTSGPEAPPQIPAQRLHLHRPDGGRDRKREA